MNRVQPENVHSTIFTPQEYQVELIDSCLHGNTVAVLASRSTRTFLVTMVTRELSHQTRSPEQGGLDQRTLIVGRSGPKLVKAGEAIQQNTNLAVATYTSLEMVKGWSERWGKVFNDSQVIVMTLDVLETGYETDFLRFDNLNLLVITDAHQILTSAVLKQVLTKVSKCCRIIAMTSPVLKHSLSPSILDTLLNYLSKSTGCKINTSSEIVTILRYINKPHERLILCTSPFDSLRPDPETEVRRLTAEAMKFLEDHRYDPVEVYGPEYAEFCIGVPDPIKEPKQILKEFITVLDNLGLWCADRVALFSLVEIEKLKKKTAYDRHYLLLCVIFSVMARVRAVIEEAFENYSELNQILNFSTPKVLRLIDILRQIRPLNFIDPRKRRDRGIKSGEECTSCNCRRKFKNKDENIGSMKAVGNSVDSRSIESSKEEGCENEERSINSFINEDVENEEKDCKITNGISDCDVLPSAEELSQSCDDVVPSLYCNGHLSKSNSEESIDTHSRSLTPESPKSPKSPVAEKASLALHLPSESTICVVATTSLPSPEKISSNKNDDAAVAKVSPSEENEPCNCSCHRHSGNLTPVIALANGCDTSSDDKDKVIEVNEQSTENSVAPDPDSKHKKLQSNEELNLVEKVDEPFVETVPDNKASSILQDEVTKNADDKNEHMTEDTQVKTTKNIKSQVTDLEAQTADDLQTQTSEENKLPIGAEERASEENSNKIKLQENVDEIKPKEDIEIIKPENSVENTEQIKSEKDKQETETEENTEEIKLKETTEEMKSEENIEEMKPEENIEEINLDEAAKEIKCEEITEEMKPEENAELESNVNKPTSKATTSEAVAMADTLAQLLPTVNRPRKRRDEVREKVKVHNPDDPDSVCGLIFVNHRTTAKIVYRLLKELSDIGGEFSWIFPQYTVELCKKASDDPRAAEAEHKKQEEVLRRFRHHECNLLVSTAVLEEGIDIPNCNLVLRFDPAINYTSYVYSRGRAKGAESFYFHLVVKEEEEKILNEMASFAAYEQVLLSECGSVDEGTHVEVSPNEANSYSPEYITSAGASVSMATAISLLNKYCAKLPSDTFTRLTAMWSIDSRTTEDDSAEYQCTIMLPINSPLKGYITGSWTNKKSLAKMSAALVSCRRLHEIGELNDNLMPVGKESMQLDAHLCGPLPDDQVAEGMPRPGSTKRRQYYYKKVSECLVGNEPSPDVDLWVYKLDTILTCPIPDEQNTRGRKIYRPELSARSLGLVTTKPIPQVSGFPVFTRSGEVMVKVKEVRSQMRISKEDLKGLECFHMFTFTHVLRLEKYPIKFHPTNATTTFFIAPLMAENGVENIDWDFVNLIQAKKDHKPTEPNEETRKNFTFKQSLYQDAVVMPWYRNQDQPQYFYVAEICSHLHPQSDFPDAGFESFEKYYLTKYGIQICNLSQPLLDVDHTSGRLNLLTPRHVNRKGVALPTTSEETKKAKRENLQQKQILVPELCTIHPFPASLWRKAVCLPTILYRLNGLLLANELRVRVALEIGLGLMNLKFDFDWPNLDFGWTLADVLAKSIEASKEAKEGSTKAVTQTSKSTSRSNKTGSQNKDSKNDSKSNLKDKSTEDCEQIDGKINPELEIGTWSNDMALTSSLDDNNDDDYEIDNFDPNIELPDNLTMLDSTCILNDDFEGELGADWGTGLPERKTRSTIRTEDRRDGVVRVGSPSNFETDIGWDTFNGVQPFAPYSTPYDDFYDYCDDFDGFESEPEYEEEDSKDKEELEWEEQAKRRSNEDKDSQSEEEDETDWPDECLQSLEDRERNFKELIDKNKMTLHNSNFYLGEKEPLVIEKAFRKKAVSKTSEMGAQTDEKLLEPSSSVSGSSVEDDATTLVNDENNDDANKTHAEKATQTDDIAFATNTEPDILYKVNREKTLDDVKSASDRLPAVFRKEQGDVFSFDCQPNLEIHPGPSPSIILQALTMSNANDGVNLERLETIGDSYLKYAITNYLYCTYTQKHEGKLSYLRSKQVSNLNLYRLGKRKNLGECMVATKFEPHDNWLPPGYFVPKELEEALIDSGVPAGHWNMADFPGLHDLGSEEIRRLVQERSEQIKQNKAEQLANELIAVSNPQDLPIFIPYNLLTQHSIPDKSISDCVEALIGAYLTTCGPRGALLFMSWLGIKVLPSIVEEVENDGPIITYHQLLPPSSPLNACPLPDAKEQLELLLSGYEEFEKKIEYTFRDRSYLLQAFTHASYYRNKLTDCYQRLEFLGDAVLDYLITRHLFEDKRQHSPGSLTDLRSALVNNTIFACLAVKFEFHKYFRHFSPGLDRVVRDFVRMQEENGHKINEEYYFMEEEECEAAEDIEVPKALGDVFESVAGAIFLDSGGSLDAVWKVYYSMMKNEIEQFSGVVPKSPIRELLETEPETAKFGKPERLVDGKVRVSVEIFGKGCFSGVGRNYRIAKSTAAKRALRHLKKLQALSCVDV